jgi:hypothetical protein
VPIATPPPPPSSSSPSSGTSGGSVAEPRLTRVRLSEVYVSLGTGGSATEFDVLLPDGPHGGGAVPFAGSTLGAVDVDGSSARFCGSAALVSGASGLLAPLVLAPGEPAAEASAPRLPEPPAATTVAALALFSPTAFDFAHRLEATTGGGALPGVLCGAGRVSGAGADGTVWAAAPRSGALAAFPPPPADAADDATATWMSTASPIELPPLPALPIGGASEAAGVARACVVVGERLYVA